MAKAYEVITETLTVRHHGWGNIYIRNKRPRGVDRFGPSEVVVLQHGATYGSGAFDLSFDGLSWTDYLARHGFDTYCLDLPGYGRSERPPQMRVPPENNPPFMRTPDATDCLATVVDHIRELRDVSRICLVGWSWGTAITSFYAANNQDSVERLVLYAPVWNREASTPSPIPTDEKIDAYRVVTREATLARRQAGLTDAQKGHLMPQAWFDAWWSDNVSNDPTSQGDTIRAPNGVAQDSKEYWNVGRPLYDPSAITAPVLITVGEWDRDTPPYMAQTLFPLFVNARWKRLSVLGGGTHAMLMETNRILLFRTVLQFLQESQPTATTFV